MRVSLCQRRDRQTEDVTPAPEALAAASAESLDSPRLRRFRSRLMAAFPGRASLVSLVRARPSSWRNRRRPRPSIWISGTGLWRANSS